MIFTNKFYRELYSTALNICGETINDICLFSDIDLLSQITGEVPQEIVPKEVKREIETRKEKIIKEIFSEIPMKLEEHYIGIYGTGRDAEHFLDEYEKYVGKIKATLIFIKSNILSKTEKYRGFDVFNINDVKDLPLECIIVASSKYESEMCKIIEENYGNKFKIFRLQSDLQF